MLFDVRARRKLRLQRYGAGVRLGTRFLEQYENAPHDDAHHDHADYQTDEGLNNQPDVGFTFLVPGAVMLTVFDRVRHYASLVNSWYPSRGSCKGNNVRAFRFHMKNPIQIPP